MSVVHNLAHVKFELHIKVRTPHFKITSSYLDRSYKKPLYIATITQSNIAKKTMTSSPTDRPASSHRSSPSPFDPPIPDSDPASLPLPLSASIILTSLPPDASTALAQAAADVDRTPTKGSCYLSLTPPHQKHSKR